MGRGLGLVCLAVLGFGACDPNSPTYFDGEAALEVGSMTDDMGQLVTQTKNTLALKFRAPTADETTAVANDSAKRGYMVPWLRQDEVHLELLYAVTNLSDKDAMFTLSLDGASEFTRYDQDTVAAAFETADEDPVFIGLITALPQTVKAHGTYHGVLREDDFTEASLDVDAMGRWMAYFASVLINRSEVNPIGLEMVPPKLLRPALFEVTVRLASQAHMTCRYSLRVRDDGGRLFKTGDKAFAPEPADYAPVFMMN